MASTKKRPSGWMKQRDKVVLPLNGKQHETLELGIKRYNEKLSRVSEAEKAFCNNRRRLDDYLQQRRETQELKDPWD